MQSSSQLLRRGTLLVLYMVMSGCVDKAPPATWPEPPPPVLAKPVLASDAPEAEAEPEPSEPLDGTNDPADGSVDLQAAEAPVKTEPSTKTPDPSSATQEHDEASQPEAK